MLEYASEDDLRGLVPVLLERVVRLFAIESFRADVRAVC